MFDYLQKFNKLPKELREKISTPAVMAAIDELEKEYGIDLAVIIMKIMVKDISINNIARYFAENSRLNEEKGKRLANDLKEKVFTEVAEYLDNMPFNRAKDRQAAGHSTALKTDRRQEGEFIEKRIQAESANKAQKASFFFSPEDEKEIRELAKKVDSYVKGAYAGENTEEKLNSIVLKANINFGSEQLSERFKNILRIYLRNIRDRIETKQVLIKPIKQGGLGFDAESAEKVLLIADGGTKKSDKSFIVNKPTRISVPEDLEIRNQKSEVRSAENQELAGGKLDKLQAVGVRDIEYNLAGELAKKKLEITQPLARPDPLARSVARSGVRSKKPGFAHSERSAADLEKLDTWHELAPPPPIIPKSASKEEKKKVTAPNNLPVSPEKVSAPASKLQEKVKPALRSASRANGKIKMEDVKFSPAVSSVVANSAEGRPRVMGPIDELRYMSLVDFRRLSEDPFQVVQKIKEKIDLFEDYSKQIEAIKAWRASPVNRLYLQMGADSIGNKKPIDVIMEERKATGREYLDNQEFIAIIELNKELRF